MEPNHVGWATKFGIKCTDGRTIANGFAKGQHKAKVPLLYQHNHKDIKQVLGHAVLEYREGQGVWSELYFNGNERAKEALEAIEHGDLDKLSIWAKDLDERIANGEAIVHDGVIQELSLVLAGANSGASLVNVLQHSNLDMDDNMMVVGGEIEHADVKEAEKPAEKPAETPKEEGAAKSQADVLNTLSEDQSKAVNGFIDDVVKEAVTEALTKAEMEHSDLNDPKKGNHVNIFDQNNSGGIALADHKAKELMHDSIAGVIRHAKGLDPTATSLRDVNEQGMIGSLRDFVRTNQVQTKDGPKELFHADDYGIQNVEVLFPDAQKLMARPTFVDRRQEWVKKFLGGTSHSPFSRVKTMYADITADEARARGWLKGNRKEEEVFPIFQRTTGPAWIYKKQALDREDIIDIVDFDVVAWMKAEMRGKLDEEIARAALFSDGRPLMVNGKTNPDKIKEPSGADGNGIRSIVNDDDVYATRYNVAIAADATGQTWNALLDATVLANEYYLGGGNKTAFISYRTATRLLTMRDDWGKRIYRNLSEVAGDMDVSSIERVPTALMPEDCLAIVLDLSDYNFGTNRGGEVTLFDDFDIHFNKYYYLMETYLSGALTTPYAAQIFMRVDPAGTLVEDIDLPTFDAATNTITIPTQTGVVYKRKDTNATVAGGTTIVLNDTNLKQLEVEAIPAENFYFESNSDQKDSKTFRYKAPAS